MALSMETTDSNKCDKPVVAAASLMRYYLSPRWSDGRCGRDAVRCIPVLGILKWISTDDKRWKSSDNLRIHNECHTFSD
ncbi:hypothetical protein DPMN_148242 [Dreissena polymorpha]|uniref:Uncharacterized protein n=1 Tax=Dreissena polymorpha TaxID=45954 RepID=A0A9D4J3P3_DREPO|nr:hypothetical protein DPMN_148242 [Dreissena polymorpha]